MNTLILTSSGKFITKNNIDSYLPKKIVDCKIAYITTASKKVHNTDYVKNHKQEMDKQKFNYTEIDIADFEETELKKILADYDIIFVEGGNAYYLLHAVRKSGFEKIVRELLPKGVVYIGSSAGSYIACPSIIMATFTEHGFDRFGITNYKSMNLVPFLLKAHYKPEMKKRLTEEFSNLLHPLRIINDNQALLIQDKQITLLGGGKEMII